MKKMIMMLALVAGCAVGEGTNEATEELGKGQTFEWLAGSWDCKVTYHSAGGLFVEHTTTANYTFDASAASPGYAATYEDVHLGGPQPPAIAAIETFTIGTVEDVFHTVTLDLAAEDDSGAVYSGRGFTSSFGLHLDGTWARDGGAPLTWNADYGSTTFPAGNHFTGNERLGIPGTPGLTNYRDLDCTRSRPTPPPL